MVVKVEFWLFFLCKKFVKIDDFLTKHYKFVLPNLQTYQVMKTNRSRCPLVNILDIVGDKWSLLIIRDLFLGKKTFTEFMKSPEKIASNILSNRLDKMIKYGLIKVTKLPNDRKTKLYYLTRKGSDMFSVVHEMINWSKRNSRKKFGPKSAQFFNTTENLTTHDFIKKSQLAYIKYRKNFLAV